MCGVTGLALADARSQPQRERLQRMADTLRHRGPDDEGILVRGPLGVGFRRLSIIDLAGGHQPIQDESGDLAVACNGEIYNFRELRAELEARGHRFRTASDVEVIVHLYEDEGPACVRRLAGMFALCVLDWRDPAAPRVLLARDRLGVKPLYWAETAEGLAWASEAKALLAGGGLPRRLRGTSLLDYLVQGYCAGPDAAWEGVRRLPPAHLLTWSAAEGARTQAYWDLPLERERDPAPAEEILAALDEAVRSHLVSDVPLGAFLSGGVDSSAVVDSMARAQEGAVVACSVGFHERAFDELDTARDTARRLGLVHHTEVLEPDPALALERLPWFYDEPLADPSTVPTTLVSEVARRHVTVALSGDGGDETFAGYRRYVFDVAENRLRAAVGGAGQRALAALGAVYPKLDWAPRPLRAKSFLSSFGVDPARAYFASATQLARADAVALLAPELARALAEHDPFDAFAEHYRRPAIDDPLYRAQYADFKAFLPEQILTKTDRASMSVSLEVRVPLLDHRFVERFVHLPAAEKVRGGRGKHALREALRGRLSARVLDGRKMGFDVPLARWLRGPLAGAVRDAVESLPERWFDRAALRRRLEEHASGLHDRSHLLWTLLVLEQWRRRHGCEEVAA